MAGGLKKFIKSVRNSKTIAEERAVIRKESAKIRTSFRNVQLDDQTRKKNIQKLLYLYIMGEPTHFGQVECLKLVATPQFSNKRLGYLATMLLLDENQEVITLITNSLDNDINSTNQYIVSSALTTLGNIASPDMARDLYTVVEAHLDGNNAYLRKKAAIVAAKLIEKEPDLVEVFLPKVESLLDDKNHAVLLGGLQLARVIHETDSTSHSTLSEFVPKLLYHLKMLVTTGYSPEYDVGGVPDPFLCVSLLQTLTMLFESDHNCPHVEAYHDLLTQIASKIDTGKNSGNVVLYEAVRSIFRINPDSSLKILGVNILAKFLKSKDNNTRYVALNTLLSVLELEPQAVQRHRATIVACLQDGDISIRRRALELTFAIINKQNIRLLAKELLTFLQNSDTDLKPYVTTQFTLVAEQYAPNEKWFFENLITMLKYAGNYISPDVSSNIIGLTIQIKDRELIKFITAELFKASVEDQTQYGLNLITTWCVGEYGDLIEGSIPSAKIVQLLARFINFSSYDDESKNTHLIGYCLTACLKLSVRLTDPGSIEQLRQLLKSKTNDMDLEIQTRAMEYLQIFSQPMSIKKGILAKMPPPPMKEKQSISLMLTSDKKTQNKAKLVDSNDLLLDLLGEDVDTPTISNGNTKSVSTPENSLDLLSDIFGDKPNNNTPNPVNSAATPQVNKGNDLLLDDLLFSPSASVAAPKVNVVVAFEDANISVGFITVENGGGAASLEAHISNKGSNNISALSLLLAVPKSQKLQLSPISTTTLQAGGSALQTFKITGAEGSKIKLRAKLGYSTVGQAVTKQFEFSSASTL
ncbi:AP-1 complex subunit gamma-1 [Komagataella phaffii CBS 7435]|uniref:AP-1 complex subunit gamma n=2 Tax=Komagataella phaffii TaxID=460519 RepID=C4R0Z6_KOMPG|nr:Gamma-adaptin, large subunit of the clathrin-associated protein (AP-1) complex [Komagataella phaffii GS115]AOA63103.1 GQ67_00589T0 [Komagataella phaffii]CAH2448305.1 AP-1 complex subunit gamma-1 [Komagataella phaffii CBS 7435]AOA66989.1 GQ68_00799T0 [Komagataella phaffii GS115]CAY69170.1 Gamma-adaptin, large subunit of the clathrin-associated protein (AP-1) complex [Komagataella phaffii GS115]CCA38439.1 AP-1 complex subunit gamma-1 [Komagataella phaffii CBS 7435]